LIDIFLSISIYDSAKEVLRLDFIKLDT